MWPQSETKWSGSKKRVNVTTVAGTKIDSESLEGSHVMSLIKIIWPEMRRALFWYGIAIIIGLGLFMVSAVTGIKFISGQ
jgi:hypothetical protein